MAKSGSISPDNTPLAATVAALPKASRSIPVAIPAATLVNNQVVAAEVPITYAGDRFYVRAASGTVYIQSLRAGNVGISNPFNVGQGQPVKGGFETLQIQNYNLFPAVALIWVGFDEFINDQLVLDNVTNPSVTYFTQPNQAGATSIAIPDLSGTAFLDGNGKKWYAISRNKIIISNFSTGTTFFLQNKGATVATGKSCLLCPAGLPIEHESSGDFSISLGGGTIPAVVCEIYTAFSA